MGSLIHSTQTEHDFTITATDPGNRCRLPPLNSKKQGTIFLDLDQTLIDTWDYSPNPENRFDFMIPYEEEQGSLVNSYVSKRPGLDRFLEEISKKFELVIFTAGTKDYKSRVLDALDPKGLISHRLYRDSCRDVKGNCVKDLAATGRDLRKSVIVDDNPNYYSLQKENGVPIIPFEGNVNDWELERLAEFFQRLDQWDDMRKAVALYLNGESD